MSAILTGICVLGLLSMISMARMVKLAARPAPAVAYRQRGRR